MATILPRSLLNRQIKRVRRVSPSGQEPVDSIKLDQRRPIDDALADAFGAERVETKRKNGIAKPLAAHFLAHTDRPE